MLTSPKYFPAAAACYTVFATAALPGPRLRPLAWVGLAAGGTAAFGLYRLFRRTGGNRVAGKAQGENVTAWQG